MCYLGFRSQCYNNATQIGFCGSLQQTINQHGIRLKGLAKGLNIAGQGHMMWLIMDTMGMLQAIKVPAYHVPGCNVHLLSTSSLLQMYPPETISLEKGKLTLSGEP